MHYRKMIDAQGRAYLEVDVSDYTLISNPLLNKGMSFTEEERKAFHLFGLIPPTVSTLDAQRERSHEAYKRKANDLEKYIYLRDLQDSNETLFYNLLTHYIPEMMPIIYTPTVGLGCQKFSHVYRRQRGIFIAYPYQHHIETILSNHHFDATEVIVVTDGERILGLGDLGANGMGIPIGKLALYSACAGIHPDATLPITLDTGTNNQELLNDPLYIGWRHERIRGDAYNQFIDQFVKAIKKRFPNVLLQWEDFAKQNATPILEKYRSELCTFNDDIQGTAAVATGTLLAAINVTGLHLRDQQIVVVGAGSAGCGISHLLMQAMMETGLSEKEALSHFYLIDQNGLLVEGMNNLMPFQKKFLQPKEKISQWRCADKNRISLQDVFNNIRPTVLVGVSGQAGAFTETLIRQMTSQVKRPIIFPLSNPTELSEATPNDLLQWTEGRAIIGTGSPFNDIMKNGAPFHIDQTNNSYIFPGLGLGLIAVQAKHITDKMFMIAAKTLADCSPAKKNPDRNLLPPLTEIREVSYKIAVAVAKEAIAEKLSTVNPNDIEKSIREKMWEPIYLPYKYKG